jgi:hypothetical protein
LRRQAARFSRPLCRCLPLRRAVDAASHGASPTSLNTASSLSPSPTPSLGDLAFGLNATGGVPIVIPDLIAVGVPDPVTPTPTSSLNPSLYTACTRSVILLPSWPPSALMVPCRTTQRCIDAVAWGLVGQMWTCARGGEGPHGRRHAPPSCPGHSPPPPLFLALWWVRRASSSPPVHGCKLVCHCCEK